MLPNVFSVFAYELNEKLNEQMLKAYKLKH